MPHHKAKYITIRDSSRTLLSTGYYREGLIKFQISNGPPDIPIIHFLMPFTDAWAIPIQFPRLTSFADAINGQVTHPQPSRLSMLFTSDGKFIPWRLKCSCLAFIVARMPIFPKEPFHLQIVPDNTFSEYCLSLIFHTCKYYYSCSVIISDVRFSD